jgi:penicillin-insensitive murein endopeptidase
MARTEPGLHFVYGETGLATGGPFKPHKSHQNGLSVDFFVPVRDPKGRSVPLPTNALNRWGYDIEITSSGRYKDYRIDFEAIAAHLAALRRQASAHGARISHVFFATELQTYLHKTSSWPAIHDLPFSTKQGWWRHDEHYHVDFSVPCKPLRQV